MRQGSIAAVAGNAIADLVAFLQSLTDQELLRDPRFANPWVHAEKP